MFYYDVGFFDLYKRSQSVLAYSLTVPLTLQPYFKVKREIRKIQLRKRRKRICFDLENGQKLPALKK